MSDKKFTYRIHSLDGRCSIDNKVLDDFSAFLGSDTVSQIIKTDEDFALTDFNGHKVTKTNNAEQHKKAVAEIVSMYGSNLELLHQLGFTEITEKDLDDANN